MTAARLPNPALVAVLLAVLAGAGGAEAGEPTPRDRHAAQCVAALEASADDLVRQVKAGQASARAPLMDRLTAGAAFIGDSYLHGNADEDRARALVDEAEAAQRRLSPAELAARQAACAAEGARLVARANPLERAVLRRLAKKRMDRLLAA
jgi:hypothetical protein